MRPNKQALTTSTKKDGSIKDRSKNEMTPPGMAKQVGSTTKNYGGSSEPAKIA